MTYFVGGVDFYFRERIKRSSVARNRAVVLGAFVPQRRGLSVAFAVDGYRLIRCVWISDFGQRVV